jgi:hypothetical protein
MCNYNFELPVDPIGLMEMVRRMIVENGGSVTGQIPNVAVTFLTPMGQVAGTCQLVSGSTINLAVTKKPEVLTCSMVRDRLVALIIEAVRLYSEQVEASGATQPAESLSIASEDKNWS